MLTKILFALYFGLTANADYTGYTEPVEQEEEKGVQVLTIQKENWQKELMKGAQSNIFLLFQDEHCRECRRGATQLVELAEMLDAQDGTQVGRIDCMYDKQVCNTWQANKLPRMLLLRDNAIYLYKGPINAKMINEDFLKDNKYEQKMISDDLEAFITEGEMKNQQGAFRPSEYILPAQLRFLETAFDTLFKSPISFMFYHLGKDYYSKFSKISIFTLIVLVPFLIVLVNTISDIVMNAMDDEVELKSPENQQIQQPPVQQQQQQMPTGTNIAMNQAQINEQTAQLRQKAEEARAAAAYYEQQLAAVQQRQGVNIEPQAQVQEISDHQPQNRKDRRAQKK